MKRTLTLWLGMSVVALLPALAQQSTGRIHGRVINPAGLAATTGTVSLSQDGGHTSLYAFPVAASGTYTGEATPGTYRVIYRAPDTSTDKMVDDFDGVKIVAGQDVEQDIDMSRQAFLDTLTPEQKANLAELQRKNAEVLKANAVVKVLNTDIAAVNSDLRDADWAQSTAVAQLGAGADRRDIANREQEIRAAKYTEIETLMLKDIELRPAESLLWLQLAQGESGLKKFGEAETDFKKALDLSGGDSERMSPAITGGAYAGLGTVYARTGKIAEAEVAFDLAAKANPGAAAGYLKNEAVIFYQMNNADALVAAAEKAIAADPAQPIPYYLKGQGLVGKAAVDPGTQKLVAPAGCLEAYRKYLELAPNGPYANEVRSTLQSLQ